MKKLELDDQGKLNIGPVGGTKPGTINIAFDSNDTSGIALNVAATPAAGSERAAIKLGGFTIGQDTAADGTTNFGIIDTNGTTLASFTTGVPAIVSELPATQYTAVATATAFAPTGAQVAGGDHTVLNLTGTLSADRILTTPTAALIVAAIAGAAAGQTYRLRIINSSAGLFTWTVAAGANVTLTGDLLIPKDTWREFNVTLTTLAAVDMQSVGTGTQFPRLPATKVSSATDTAGFTLTGAQVAGAQDVSVKLTGALTAAAAATLPTAANIVAAIPNATIGQTYHLRLSNESTGDYVWTVTTNTGLTLSGVMTIAKGEFRDFAVVLTSLSAVAVTSVGSGLSKTAVDAAIDVGGARVKYQFAIPLIFAPTGSFGNNGALTSGTANPLAYVDTYTYFPADAIVAGSAAGWYWTVWSNTTTATVYNNTWNGTSNPAAVDSPTAFATTGPGAFTGPTLNAAYATLAMAAANVTDQYDVEIKTTQTDTANAKTVTMRFSALGGTLLWTDTLTSLLETDSIHTMKLNGIADKQLITGKTFGTTGFVRQAAALAAETTASPWSFALCMSRADATEVVVIENLRVMSQRP
jgi:hypothetical protein